MATRKTGYRVWVTCSTNMKLILRLCSVDWHSGHCYILYH